VKLREKRRVSARLRRRYDLARTPLERLTECVDADQKKLTQLRTLQHQLDPFELARRIDQALTGIQRLANRRVNPAAPTRPPAIKPRHDLILPSARKEHAFLPRTIVEADDVAEAA
jgi:hypothetical protein